MPRKNSKKSAATPKRNAAAAPAAPTARAHVQPELDKLHAELAEMDLAGRLDSLRRARIWASLLNRLDAMIDAADHLHELGRVCGQAKPDAAETLRPSLVGLIDGEPATVSIFVLERDLALARNRLPLLDSITYSRAMADAIEDVIGRIRGQVVDERHTAAESIAAAMLAVTQLYEQDYRKALHGIDGDRTNLRSPPDKPKTVLRILLAVRERLSAAEVADRISKRYSKYEKADDEWVRKAVEDLRAIGFEIDNKNGYLLSDADRELADRLCIAEDSDGRSR